MIGLIDVDSKLPNLALMKISNYYKSVGEPVEFVKEKGNYTKIYASAIFTRSEEKCNELMKRYGGIIEIGGTGFSLEKKLPPEIEGMRPDYDLYTTDIIYQRIKGGIGKKESKIAKAQTIVNAGMGFSSRGCVRNCQFCRVPKAEGAFCQATEIKDLLNPRSNVLVLNDNNLTADPYVIDKLKEIRERGLIVDISQGVDVRLVTSEICDALSKVRHLRSIHYSWDLLEYENQVFHGIRTLTKYIKAYRHMCFVLVGYNSEFAQDMFRFRKLVELGIAPYIMIFDEKKDTRLKHFARWVNGRIYKKEPNFDNYLPWINAQERMAEAYEIERTQYKWAF